MDKIIDFIDNTIDRIIIIIAIIILLLGGYLIYDNAYVFYNASGSRVMAYKPETPEEAAEILGELSEDCIAWVTIDNTKIDYPIVQGKDNIEYLNKDAYGKYNLSGAIFLDSRNSYDFSDKYSLIYGHHMSEGYLLGALDNWMDKNYFDNHLNGKIITKDGIEYTYTIFAICELEVSENEIFDPVGRYPINVIKNTAIHYNEPLDGNLVVFSTCKSPTSTRRLILCGIISK